MKRLTKTRADEIIRALEPPARAWKNAKRKGYVWVNPQTQLFETWDHTGAWAPKADENPNQLRLT